MFGKVNALEHAKQELAIIPTGTIQTVQGTLELPRASDYLLGNPQAKITIIEYSDFECPQCQQIHPTLLQLLNRYQNQVKLISRFFPLPQNANAQKEAEAALCAGSIGKTDMFFRYSNAIFHKTTGTEGGMGFPLNNLVPLAKRLGLPQEKFQSCLSSGTFAKEVTLQKQSGQDAGVDALPALFIFNGKTLPSVITGNQTYEVLKAVVDEKLAEL